MGSGGGFQDLVLLARLVYKEGYKNVRFNEIDQGYKEGVQGGRFNLQAKFCNCLNMALKLSFDFLIPDYAA